jgi:hypothetical protein
MGFVVRNIGTKKFLVKKQGLINLTISDRESATIFSTENEVNKQASNFEPYELIKV